jgi:hypothetical protein
MQMRSAETFGRSIPATFYKKPSAGRHPGNSPSIHHLVLLLHYTLIFNELDILLTAVDCVGKMSAGALGGGIRATDLYKSHIIF